MATSQHIRAVALILKEYVEGLYNDILPIYTAVEGWTLDNIDDNLPLEGDVKSQLEAYETIIKYSVNLAPALSDVKQSTGAPAEGIFYLPARSFPLAYALDGWLLADQIGSQAFGNGLQIRRVTVECGETGDGGDDLTVDVRLNGLSIFSTLPEIAANSGQDVLYITPLADISTDAILAGDVMTIHLLTVPNNSKNVRVVTWVEQ